MILPSGQTFAGRTSTTYLAVCEAVEQVVSLAILLIAGRATLREYGRYC